MCAVIIVFAIPHILGRITKASKRQNPVKGNKTWQRTLAGTRFLGYRTFYLRGFNWYSPAAGVILLGMAGFIYFMCKLIAVYHLTIWTDSGYSNVFRTQTILLANIRRIWRLATYCNQVRLVISWLTSLRNVSTSHQLLPTPLTFIQDGILKGQLDHHLDRYLPREATSLSPLDFVGNVCSRPSPHIPLHHHEHPKG